MLFVCIQDFSPALTWATFETKERKRKKDESWSSVNSSPMFRSKLPFQVGEVLFKPQKGEALNSN